MKHERVFSGVQPSAGQVHLGNYLGALRRFVVLAQRYETMVCIVDLHALTTVNDAQVIHRYTRSLAAAYLAVGLNPETTIIFRQSDVPEVCELSWYLACHCPLGLLERAHAYKDARAKNIHINSAVMFYPVLMAADVLLYQGSKVPVGADQKQHIEMMRDIAERFNAHYGEVFTMPEALIDEATGVVVGLDGRKMSKSYNNYIGLFEEPTALKKKVMSIITDSKTIEDRKDPGICNVFRLFQHFATPEEITALEMRYREGGMGYGHAKEELFRVIEREVGPLRASYNRLMAEPGRLTAVLSNGAHRARGMAQVTLDAVRTAVGVGGRLG